MILEEKYKDFLLKNRKILTELFEGRIKDLTNLLINEDDEKKQSKITMMLRETKFWLDSVKISNKEDKMDKTNFI